MGRIGTKPLDTSPDNLDRLIGTDNSDGSTKNFSVGELVDRIADQIIPQIIGNQNEEEPDIKFWAGTQEQYDMITEFDENTQYIIHA